MQRLFHWQGERAVARAAEKFGTYFGISTIGTVSIEEIGRTISTPKLFQLYVHRDPGPQPRAGPALPGCRLRRACADRRHDRRRQSRARPAHRLHYAAPADAAIGAELRRPSRLDARTILLRERFALANLKEHVDRGTNVATGVAEYINSMLDPSMDWKAAEAIRADWGGPFALKGIMSVADARRAVDIGATAIIVSNHGGRQLDGCRAPFDQLAEIVDAVGDRIEVICEGGIRRGSHVLKALSVGARACAGGRLYLYALAAAGQPASSACSASSTPRSSAG